jgi:hypothetical protein
VVDQSDVDSITNFGTGDMITTDGGIGGDGTAIQNGTSMTWSQFLTNAENQIDNLGHSVYTAIVGGSTYVAMADSVNNDVHSIVEIVGVDQDFTLAGGVLTYA